MSCVNFTNEEPWILIENISYFWYDYVAFVLIVIAIVGNSFVILIQSRLGGARVGGKSANRLIIGLAVADLLTAFFYIPLPEYVNVPPTTAGEFYCRVIEPKSLAWVCFMASVYTLTTISIERYLAIAYPYSYRTWAKHGYEKFAFSLIWLAAVLINLFTFLFGDMDECGRCLFNFPSLRSRKVFGVFLFIFEYFGPLCIMSYTNLQSILKLRQYSLGLHVASKATLSQDAQAIHRRLTTMFTVIFVTFFVLWTPDQICFLVYNLGVLSDNFTKTVAYKVLVKAAFVNACTMNPFIYSVWVPSFRRQATAYLTCRGIGNIYLTDTDTR
ncbi:allatostatin-A receptor-like [Diadema setosum]|uniref:allatostatin-A receptor-like n=1 Tax=Diadema setosum TaxID=31175 RepID=UPI003B3AF1CF